MVDFLAYTSDFAVLTELSDNVSIVFALAECHTLVNWLLGVTNNIFESERSKLIPLILGCFQGHSVRVLSTCLNVFVVNLGRSWNRLLLGRRVMMNDSVSLLLHSLDGVWVVFTCWLNGHLPKV